MKKISTLAVLFFLSLQMINAQSGQTTSKRQHEPIKVKTGTQNITRETKDSFNKNNQVIRTQTNKNVKDPFNPGSPDDDLRNPFDSSKKVKAKQPVNTQAKYDLKNTQVSGIKPADKQKQQTTPANQAVVNKTNVQPVNKPVQKINPNNAHRGGEDSLDKSRVKPAIKLKQ